MCCEFHWSESATRRAAQLERGEPQAGIRLPKGLASRGHRLSGKTTLEGGSPDRAVPSEAFLCTQLMESLDDRTPFLGPLTLLNPLWKVQRWIHIRRMPVKL